MVIIEITNVEELIGSKIGPFAAKLVHALADDEGKVEKVLIEELQANFEANGIKANLFSVNGASMSGSGKLEIPLHVRASKML